MKRISFFLISILIISCHSDNVKINNYPIQQVEIKNVLLNDNFWLPVIKTVQEVTINAAFKKCEKEGRMESFLIAGSFKKGKVKGKMPFDDTDLYKIIEGASYSMVSNPNPELDKYIDSVISIIAKGQEPDGYLTTWFTINPMEPPAPWVKPSGKRWYNIGGHELYNSGHLFEAAAAHYHATGKKNLLNIAIKNADLLVKSFGPDTIQIPPGHQIVETGLIKLYQITRNKDYLELSKFFLDTKGDSTTHKLEGPYSQDHLPVIQQDEAVGHAVRAVYMYAGMTDIAVYYNDRDYLNAVNRLWENVVNKKMYLTGGIGALHRGESFGENYELPNLTSYSETCAAIGNVYWNHRLFLLSGNAKYYDIIERTLYNGLLSGISLDGTCFFYPNPLEANGEYKFNQGSCTRSEWFDCSCCPTNLIRFIPGIPGLIYATQKDTLYINLYMSNRADVDLDKNNIQINQSTNYPWDSKIDISINPDKAKTFSVKLRIPGWAVNKPVPGNLYQYVNSGVENITVLVNSEAIASKIDNGYITVSQNWEKGDFISLQLPMNVKLTQANNKVKEDSGKVAIEYGPLVYCAEEIDNLDLLNDATITENTSFEIDKKPDILGGVKIIEVKNNKNSIVCIPYYAWSNRGIGKMKVWFPLEKSEN